MLNGMEPGLLQVKDLGIAEMLLQEVVPSSWEWNEMFELWRAELWQPCLLRQDLSRQVRETSARVLQAMDWPEAGRPAGQAGQAASSAANLRSKPLQALRKPPFALIQLSHSPYHTSAEHHQMLARYVDQNFLGVMVARRGIHAHLDFCFRSTNTCLRIGILATLGRHKERCGRLGRPLGLSGPEPLAAPAAQAQACSAGLGRALLAGAAQCLNRSTAQSSQYSQSILASSCEAQSACTKVT